MAGGTLSGSSLLAAEGQGGGKPKIRVVFCETSNKQPIWPNIGYDFDARRNRILETLTRGCPGLEFLPARVVDDPKHVAEVLKADGAVDGYLVCVQGLGWGNDIFKLSTTGKPTLLADNLFGGSGLFLLQQPRIMQSGKPVDWVSSSNDQDLVASARNFALLKQGKSAAEVAAAFRATRHGNTPATTDWTCKDDPVPAPNFEEALRELRQTKILVVGGGWGGAAFSKAAEATLGVQLVAIAFEELAGAHAAADPAAARECADRWMHAAHQVVEPGQDEIQRSAAMYLGMKNLMEKHGARGISVNCLGGFYGGKLKAYPCLGFSQFNSDGLIGGCEGDQMSALTMATMGALVGRPGYISDPVIDTSKGQIIYAHCVATIRPFGPKGPTNPFRIRNHSEDRKGASVQSLLPEGYLVTSMEINPTLRQVILFQAKTAGNNFSDMACRTTLEGIVKGDIEKLTEHWGMGWHRVTFYGNLKEHVAELCARLKFKLIEEA
jgi:hypothetical protein